MVRFIFACMAIMVLSVALTPMYFGIKNTKDALSQSQEVVAQNANETLSFEQIYETAATAGDLIDPSLLNAIAPAAGEEVNELEEQEDEFSNGFSGQALSTLAE